MLVVDRDASADKLIIKTLRIFDDRDNIIVRFKDGWYWKDDSARVEKPDPSTLIVFDHNDKEVLHLKFLNRHVLSFAGVLRHKGVPGPVVVDDNGAVTPHGHRDYGNVYYDVFHGAVMCFYCPPEPRRSSP